MIESALNLVIRKLISVKSKLYTSLELNQSQIQSKRSEKWFKENGDKTHRLNYDINNDSLVMDLGGYEGQWASDIYSKYNCEILVFEPYLPFYEQIKARFYKNNNIRVYPFGLGAKSEKVDFLMKDNSSTVITNEESNHSVNIQSIVEFLKENNIQKIDLVKINIEGSEYELLESLIEAGMLGCFNNIQVQFHDFVIENASDRMKQIQSEIAKTHQLTYQYEFVWENWQLK